MVWHRSDGLRCFYSTISSNRYRVASIFALTVLDSFETHLSLRVDSHCTSDDSRLSSLLFQSDTYSQNLSLHCQSILLHLFGPSDDSISVDAYTKLQLLLYNKWNICFIFGNIGFKSILWNYCYSSCVVAIWKFTKRITEIFKN